MDFNLLDGLDNLDSHFVVSVSGGLSSTEALERTLARYGHSRVTAVFADVGSVVENGKVVCGEDEDLLRFMGEAEKYLGVHINRVKHPKYKDIWDCFFGRRFMGSSRVDVCSKEMKRELLDKWVKTKYPKCIRVLGFSWLEKHRAEKFKVYFPTAYFPICDPPYTTNDEIAEKWEARGIKRSRSYEEGFSHDNCGGMCVKMGIGQAYQLWYLRPWRYEYAERRELEFRRKIKSDVTIFKRAGIPITMMGLRFMFERGFVPKSIDTESCGGRCMLPYDEGK